MYSLVYVLDLLYMYWIFSLHEHSLTQAVLGCCPQFPTFCVSLYKRCIYIEELEITVVLNWTNKGTFQILKRSYMFDLGIETDNDKLLRLFQFYEMNNRNLNHINVQKCSNPNYLFSIWSRTQEDFTPYPYPCSFPLWSTAPWEPFQWLIIPS